jgi:hypothetical protein
VNEQLDKAVATYADPTGTGRPDADNLAAFIKVYGRRDPVEVVGLLAIAVRIVGWTLDEAHDTYPRIDGEFENDLDASLDPRGPSVLIDFVAGFGLVPGSVAVATVVTIDDEVATPVASLRAIRLA